MTDTEAPLVFTGQSSELDALIKHRQASKRFDRVCQAFHAHKQGAKQCAAPDASTTSETT